MNLSFDVDSVRQDFPILSKKIHNRPLVYFDNAATSQTPVCVIDCIKDYYEKYNSNIHRGVHSLSDEATNAYENARNKIKDHFNINESKEVIFTSGTTHSINIVSNGFSKILKKGDEIIVSGLEHHSNIVPWQMLCKEKKANLKYFPIDSNGDVDVEKFSKEISKKTKLVSITHMSNVLGTVLPIDEIIAIAKSVNAVTVVDACQSVPHMPVDVQKIDSDFLCFSGHKMLAPTGIGVLHGKEDILNSMSPFMFGGDMISEVTYEDSKWNDLPYKFEAGTPNIADSIGLGVACEYLQEIGMENIWNLSLIHISEPTRPY